MPSFLDTSSFLNVVYALNIALETHFSNIGLGGDLNRVVYAKKDYCFRERARQRENGGTVNPNKDKTASLDFPFMQYSLVNIAPSTDRKMFNNLANLEGILLDDVGKKIRVTPMKVEYSLSYFFQRLDDTLKCYTDLLTDNANETILYPSLSIDDEDEVSHTFPISAFLQYSNFSVDQDKYSSSENDWLKTNKLHVLTIDGMAFDTLALSSDTDDVSITETAVLNFMSSKDGYDGDLDDIDTLDPQELITQYFTVATETDYE